MRDRRLWWTHRKRKQPEAARLCLTPRPELRQRSTLGPRVQRLGCIRILSAVRCVLPGRRCARLPLLHLPVLGGVRLVLPGRPVQVRLPVVLQPGSDPATKSELVSISSGPVFGEEIGRSSPFPQAGIPRGVLHGDGQDGGDHAAADDGVQGQSHGDEDAQTGFTRFKQPCLGFKSNKEAGFKASIHGCWDSCPAKVRPGSNRRRKVTYLWLEVAWGGGAPVALSPESGLF